jgi:hypothetical protein
MQDFQRLILPAHHEVLASDVDMKKLGNILWLARENEPENFEDLLMLKGVGPKQCSLWLW